MDGALITVYGIEGAESLGFRGQLTLDFPGGNSYSSKTVSGVVSLLQRRTDIENLEGVINSFKSAAARLLRRMADDGFSTPTIPGL